MATIQEAAMNGSVYEEISVTTEDTESTHSSADLDHDITVDILLPDNSVKKTTMLASTPWMDVRTLLCSRFKLSPSGHVVDFISTSTSSLDKKRKASKAIGKMEISMITIQDKKNVTTKHVTPRPVSSSTENTVRLIVRQDRLRQSIIRVNPDVCLKNTFVTVCEKLKLSDQNSSRMELRHPLQDDLKLNLDLTLNHYNLRELYLVEKGEMIKKNSKAPPLPPSRTKRKAPKPPQTASPPVSPLSKTPPPTELPEKIEPVYAKVQKKPVPAKRRAAPRPPPQADLSLTVKSNPDSDKENIEIPPTSQAKPEEVAKDAEDINDSEEVTNLLNEIIQEEIDGDICDELDEKEESKDIVLDAERLSKQQIQNHALEVREHQEQPMVVEEKEMEISEKILIEEVIKDAADAEVIVTQVEIKKDVTPDEVILLDEVINDIVELDESENKPEILEDEKQIEDTSLQIEKVEQNKTEVLKYGDITVYDVVDDGITGTNESSEIKEKLEPSDPTPQEAVTNDNRESAPPAASTEVVDLPLPPQSPTMIKDIKLPTEKAKETKEKKTEDKANKKVPVTVIEVKDGSKKSQRIEEKKTNTKDEEEMRLMEENERTALEIERLRLEIKKMRKRNSVKQTTQTDLQRNSWHPASQSVKVTPVTKQQQPTHKDYNVAPAKGIKLSSNGEIKGENGSMKKDQTKVSNNAPKLRSTLPSYYKKFLGVSAFAAAKDV